LAKLMIDGTETYTYTHTYGRTDGRKEWRWDSKRGISLSTLFIPLAFSPALAFSLWAWAWGLLFPPVHKHAPADPWSYLLSLLFILLLLLLLLTLPFIACLYLFPPSIGSENARNSAHDSRSFYFLFIIHFPPRRFVKERG
jgi:hypothetical protein